MSPEGHGGGSPAAVGAVVSAPGRRCKHHLSTVGLLAALPACTALPCSAGAGLLGDWSCVEMGLQAVAGDNNDDKALTALDETVDTVDHDCGLRWRPQRCGSLSRGAVSCTEWDAVVTHCIIRWVIDHGWLRSQSVEAPPACLIATLRLTERDQGCRR